MKFLVNFYIVGFVSLNHVWNALIIKLQIYTIKFLISSELRGCRLFFNRAAKRLIPFLLKFCTPQNVHDSHVSIKYNRGSANEPGFR